MNEKTGRILRTVAIVFLGLTAAMNILGGVGTTCAAFGFTREYRIAFYELQDFKWLYQILVVATILIGLVGIWATIALAQGKHKAFRNALIVLIIGSILGGVQYIASQALRGEATPANVKFFANAATLVLFLVIRLPSIWKHVDFSVPESRIDGATAGGLAAIVAGLIVLTVPSWAGPSHTYFGENWVNILLAPLTLGGLFLIVVGVLLVARQIITAIRTAGPLLDTRQPVPRKINND